MSDARPPLLEGSRLAFLCALLGGITAGVALGLERLGLLQACALYLALIGLITFLMFAGDKRRARLGRRRISESNLLWLAGLGGGIGGWLAMRALRHKTRSRVFRFVIPTACVLQLTGLAYVAYRTYSA